MTCNLMWETSFYGIMQAGQKLRIWKGLYENVSTGFIYLPAFDRIKNYELFCQSAI